MLIKKRIKSEKSNRLREQFLNLCENRVNDKIKILLEDCSKAMFTTDTVFKCCVQNRIQEILDYNKGYEK